MREKYPDVLMLRISQRLFICRIDTMQEEIVKLNYLRRDLLLTIKAISREFSLI